MSDLAQVIKKVFDDNGFHWKIGGEQVVPTVDDIEAVLDRARYEVEYQAANSHMKIKSTGTQVTMRHLLFKLDEDDGSVQVFVHLGEIE